MKTWHYIFLALLVLVAGLFLLRQCNSTESLEGVDSNRDGVRDDLEKLIDEKYASDPNIRSAVRQLAKTLQESILHPETVDAKPGLFAITCLYYVTPQQASEIIDTLQAAAGNTRARASALIRESAKFNGKIFEGAGSREEACAFDPALVK